MTTKKGKEIKMANIDDKLFMTACGIAGVAPTARQYRKWKRGYGSARANQQAAHEKMHPAEQQ